MFLLFCALAALAAPDASAQPASTLTLAPPAAYKGGKPGAASLIGRVRLNRLPPPKKFQVTKNADKCGREKSDASVIYSSDKGLKNVAIWIDGVRVGKDVPKDNVILKNITCMYEPRVTVTAQGTTLELRNYDGTQMNATAYLRPGTLGFGLPMRVDAATPALFSAALPVKGLIHKRKLSELGLLDLRADPQQPWVQAFVWVLDHPYGSVSDDGGYFAIEKLPAGPVTVHAWHEVYGHKSQTVEIPADPLAQSVRVDFEY
ncbi:MAG: hypothetical protein IT381_25520 [Deltaproteobacteria bacterium]|nr:hypothetical protein [Deltaproteobacteria bacterium]